MVGTTQDVTWCRSCGTSDQWLLDVPMVLPVTRSFVRSSPRRTTTTTTTTTTIITNATTRRPGCGPGGPHTRRRSRD